MGLPASVPVLINSESSNPVSTNSMSSITSIQQESTINESNTKKIMVNVVNLEKKQSKYGLIQDLMTLGYCSIIIPLAISNIMYGKNNFSWSINVLTYLYFVITGLINLYYLEYNFIVHHIICLNLIYLSHYDTFQEYLIWLSYCFMAEISNIFLSLKNLLKHLEKIFKLSIKSVYTLNDFLFLISYFGIRIFYLMPLTYQFVRENYLNLKFPKFVIINIVTMSLLNLYWGYLIIKKVHRTIDKTNKPKTN
jgi:hypothetical protein